MPRLDKKRVIDLITAELDKGETSRAVILSKTIEKCQISERSWDRHWREARRAYTEARAAIESKKMEQTTQAELNRHKEAILSREQRLEIASKIAKGEAWRVGNTVMAPTAGDRVRALDYISKIEGDYAPTKTELSGSLHQMHDPKLDLIFNKLDALG